MEVIYDTVEIRVLAFGILKEFVKDKSVKLRTCSSLFDLFNFMIERYGLKFKKLVMDAETNQISPSISILLNGTIITNLDTNLTDGDEVTLFILVSGG